MLLEAIRYLVSSPAPALSALSLPSSEGLNSAWEWKLISVVF